MRQLNGRSNVKGVAFLDPYRDNLEWETVEALAQNRGFEVIINLPLHMAINRLLAKQVERNIEWEERIDRCFGTPEWRQIVYPSVEDMFGTVLTPKSGEAPELLLGLYLKRLKLAFGHVATPMLIRNTKNVPLYFIIWAGPHSAGLKGAEYILGGGEKLAAKRR
jgi:three-Cys-motif partner protein